jgi:hypothetical protein
MRGTSSSITNTYTLKIDKALKKKLDATKRQQNVLYEYTKEGLVITADAATFELLRIAANIYYENFPESLIIRCNCSASMLFSLFRFIWLPLHVAA